MIMYYFDVKLLLTIIPKLVSKPIYYYILHSFESEDTVYATCYMISLNEKLYIWYTNRCSLFLFRGRLYSKHYEVLKKGVNGQEGPESSAGWVRSKFETYLAFKTSHL